MLQNFQQQPVKPDPQPPVHSLDTQAPSITADLSMAALQQPLHAQPVQQKSAFDKVVTRYIVSVS